MHKKQNEISKEEAYNKNFGLENKELNEYDKNEILAEDMYSTNHILEISYKKSPTLIFYRLMKGLLTPRLNHIATHAIVEGSIFEKRLMRKLLAFSLLPFLAIIFSVISIGTIFSGINSENIKINLVTIGVLLGIFMFAWGGIYSFLFIKSYILEKAAKYIFKTNVSRLSIQVVLIYWMSIVLITSLLSWVFSIFASLSMPLFGTVVALFLHLGLFTLIFWMFHKSMAYTLRIKTYKFILLNTIFYVILLGMIYIFTVFI
jgi:hypothetical protein